MNESLLIKELANGSRDAFQVLYYQYVPAIRLNIGKLIKDENVVDDLVQDVFIALWENRIKIRREQGVAAWLYTVSYNKSVTYLRQQLKMAQQSADDIALHLYSDDTPLEIGDLRLTLVEKAIDLLPERKRLAFTLYRMRGQSLDEVASQMGITRDTVKGYIKEVKHFIIDYVKATEPTMLLTMAVFLLPACL